MTAILVDSNVLLGLMTEDARWVAWSAGAIEQAADNFRLVINPVIYAEVSVRYSRIEDVDEALSKTMFDREAIVMSQVGVDRIMLGSDYCFDVGYEHPVQFVEQLSLTAEERLMVLNGTAAKLLKI